METRLHQLLPHPKHQTTETVLVSLNETILLVNGDVRFFHVRYQTITT